MCMCFGDLYVLPLKQTPRKTASCPPALAFLHRATPSVYALKRSWCHGPKVLGIDLFWKEQILTLGGLPSTCQHGDPAGRGGGLPIW